MPVETPPPHVVAYQVFILLAGIACFVHYFFFLKSSKRIEADRTVPGWQLRGSDFFLGLFIIILAVLFVQGTLAFFIGDAVEHEDAIQIILFGGAMQLTALGVLFALYKTIPEKFQDPFNRRNVTWSEALKLALYAFFIVIAIHYPLAYGWIYLLEAAGQEVALQDTVSIFAEIDQLPVLILMFILTVIGAPLSEEILFRGCLYRFLKARMPMIGAILLSGLLFAFLHPNLMSFAPLFLLGIVLAYAYEQTGSIKVPILIHGIFNLNTVIIIVLTMDRA